MIFCFGDDLGRGAFLYIVILFLDCVLGIGISFREGSVVICIKMDIIGLVIIFLRFYFKKIIIV